MKYIWIAVFLFFQPVWSETNGREESIWKLPPDKNYLENLFFQPVWSETNGQEESIWKLPPEMKYLEVQSFFPPDNYYQLRNYYQLKTKNNKEKLYFKHECHFPDAVSDGQIIKIDSVIIDPEQACKFVGLVENPLSDTTHINTGVSLEQILKDECTQDGEPVSCVDKVKPFLPYMSQYADLFFAVNMGLIDIPHIKGKSTYASLKTTECWNNNGLLQTIITYLPTDIACVDSNYKQMIFFLCNNQEDPAECRKELVEHLNQSVNVLDLQQPQPAEM